MSSSDRDKQGGVDTVVKKRNKIAHPKQFRVILLNDDYTSMDFVVAVLEGIFRKSPAEAVQVMLSVHKRGSGLAGIYPKEIAEAKIEMVHSKAKDAGYPLRCAMEPEG
jgi:ATP-dependent Clp protease adaptor protein ClpS